MLDMLDLLPAVSIVILKPDGTRLDAVAQVTEKLAFIEDVNVAVAGGDIVEHLLPSGAIQRYEVIQVNAYPEPEPHLQVRIRPLANRRPSPATAASGPGVQVTITNSVVDGAVQVGSHNHATVTAAARYDAATQGDEIREHLLAALDQSIATHRLAIDAAEQIDEIRQGIAVLVSRIAALAGDVQLSREALRGIAELAAAQVPNNHRAGLRAWLASHPTPVLQNIFASVVFEAMKAGLGG